MTTNRCSFPFDSDFKVLIKNERESPKIQALQTCKTKDQFEKVQGELRIYLKEKYPTYFKIRYSDMFAFVIALIHPHLYECTEWEDIKFRCPNEANPDVGFDWTFNISFSNMKSTCVCGHSITASNSYIVYHKEGPLRIVVGCCCIDKNEIVEDFHLVKKQRQIRIKQYIQQQIDTWNDYNKKLVKMHNAMIQQQIDTWKNYNNTLLQMHETRIQKQIDTWNEYNKKLKKLHTDRQLTNRFNLFPARQFFTICKNLKQQEQQQIDTWNDYNKKLVQMHETRIQQQIDTWKNYNNKLLELHRTRSHSSCQLCKNKIKVNYKICIECHQKGCRPLSEFDICSCGKTKKKDYPKCYKCRFLPHLIGSGM